MTTALIIVDIQNDYFKNGKMELVNPDQAADNAAKVLNLFRENNKENIFHVQHIAADPAMGFFLPDTEGADIHKSVKPSNDEAIITKHFPNSFLQTDLESKLKANGVTDVVITGMMTHMCIDATARAAVELGFNTTVIEDACATLDLSYNGHNVPAEHVHYSFIGALNGMYAKITATEDFLKES